MARFLGTSTSPHGILYNYGTPDRFCTIPGSMLVSLFYAYGCIVDPCDRSGTCLSPEVVSELQTLAHRAKDGPLCRILAPHSGPHLSEITHQEQECFANASRAEQNAIISAWVHLLEVGLYLAGWKPNETGVQFKMTSKFDLQTSVEPYPTKIVPVSDPVRMEFQIWPLLDAISKSPCGSIESFPLIKYVRSASQTASPRILKGTIGSARQSIGHQDPGTIAEPIISTAYYYLTVIAHTPLPMLKPLIGSFVA